MSAPVRLHAPTSIEGVVADRAITPQFQPIVNLLTGERVGYEALARGPEGTELSAPDQLFAAARHRNHLAELDWLCQEAALTTGVDGLGPSECLFVNVEPSVLAVPQPGYLDRLWRENARRARLIAEISERSVLTNPAALLRAVERARGLGIGIAIDDVGSNPASLALIPLVSPDVIKLDIGLVQAGPSPHLATILRAVQAQVERTGALLLAEGIETPEHHRFAVELGATLGQGWLFGRPAAMPAAPERGPVLVPTQIPWVSGVARPRSPFAVAERTNAVRVGRRPLLVELSHNLEDLARLTPSGAVVLSSFQHRDRFTPATRERYVDLARHSCFVGVVGAGFDSDPAPGVRAGRISGDSPLRREWAVVILSAHFSGALLARRLDPDGDGPDEHYQYAITHDRSAVLEAAVALLHTIANRR